MHLVYANLFVALGMLVGVRLQMVDLYRRRGDREAASESERAATLKCGLAVFFALADAACRLNLFGMGGVYDR